jgi:hypothetical protein
MSSPLSATPPEGKIASAAELADESLVRRRTDESLQALNAGDLEAARRFAEEVLRLAPRFPKSWNYGNALHYGHLVLGMVALRANDVQRAKEQLLEAGRTPGSPQLDSFGPNMALARALLLRGERKTVAEYLKLCGAFWKGQRNRKTLARWNRDIQRGNMPNFGPNLIYGGWKEPEEPRVRLLPSEC